MWDGEHQYHLCNRELTARFHHAMAGGDASLSEIKIYNVFQNVGEEVNCKRRTVLWSAYLNARQLHQQKR
jgi:hypothetical protein